MALMFVPLLMFVRFVKYSLGFRDPPDPPDDWTSGDQLTFYANKDLKTTTWPGGPAGQGTLHTDRWRGGRR